jgi:hypothetical protein
MTQKAPITGRFRVDYENNKGYAVYYMRGNGCYMYSRTYNRHGCLVDTPTRKISKLSYDTSKPFGTEF